MHKETGGRCHHTDIIRRHRVSELLSNDRCECVAMVGWTHVVGNGWAAPQHRTDRCVMRRAAFGGGNATLSMRQCFRYGGSGNQGQQTLSRSVPLASQPVACSVWRRVGTDGGFSMMHGDQMNEICMPRRREKNLAGVVAVMASDRRPY